MNKSSRTLGTLLVVLVAPLLAMERPADGVRGTWFLSVDNDLFNGSDDHSTFAPEVEFGLARRMQVKLALERTFERESDPSERTTVTAVHTRLAVLRRPALAVAVQSHLARSRTGAGSRREFLTSAGADALLSWKVRALEFDGNLGFTSALHHDQQDEIRLGAAGSWNVSETLKLSGEICGTKDPNVRNSTQWVGSLAAKQTLTRTLQLGLRIGAGLNRRSPNLTVLIGFEWEP